MLITNSLVLMRTDVGWLLTSNRCIPRLLNFSWFLVLTWRQTILVCTHSVGFRHVRIRVDRSLLVKSKLTSCHVWLLLRRDTSWAWVDMWLSSWLNSCSGASHTWILSTISTINSSWLRIHSNSYVWSSSAESLTCSWRHVWIHLRVTSWVTTNVCTRKAA
mgnify:CR=1 FL=1